MKNICKRLLFNFSNGSLFHGPKGLKGLDSMTASGFRVRATGLVFVFKSASLVLKHVPTCIRKPKTKNTFHKSIKFLHLLFLVILDGLKSFQIVLGCFSSFLTLVSTGHFILTQRKSSKTYRALLFFLNPVTEDVILSSYLIMNFLVVTGLIF